MNMKDDNLMFKKHTYLEFSASIRPFCGGF